MSYPPGTLIYDDQSCSTILQKHEGQCRWCYGRTWGILLPDHSRTSIHRRWYVANLHSYRTYEIHKCPAANAGQEYGS